VRGAETSYRGTPFSERMKDAPCLTTDPDVGYPGGEGKRGSAADVAHLAAKRICQGCPMSIKAECLEVAMKTEGAVGSYARHGVFGGLDPEERAKKHRRDGETPCPSCLAAESATWHDRPRKSVAS